MWTLAQRFWTSWALMFRLACRDAAYLNHRAFRAFIFFQNKGFLMFGLRSENWKYIYNSVTGKEQLFDLGQDPHEQKNVAGSFPGTAHEFRQRITAWIYCQTHH
jgi:hypothetical protein